MSDSLVSIVENVFLDSGGLSKATPDYIPRPSQIEFAKSVARALEEHRSLIVEAGTGTGKTFAYLVPALLNDNKVLISTGGKTLQDQLYKKDIPAVIRALGIPARVEILKGRANYICLARFENAFTDNIAKTREEVAHLQEIKRFVNVTQSGDRSDISTVPESSPIWRAVTSTSENCLGENCPDRENCFVYKARDAARDATVLVINHHLFLADMALRDEDFTDFLPDFDVVIFDEAHQLPDVAVNFFSAMLSTADIRRFAEDAMVLGVRKLVNSSVNFRLLADRVRNRIDDLREKFRTIGLPDDARETLDKVGGINLVAEPLEKISNALEGLTEPFAPVNDDPEVVKLLDVAYDLQTKLRNWEGICANMPNVLPGGPSSVRWFSLSAKNVFFSESPLDNSNSFRKTREERGKPWILTSATLSVSGNFDLFKKEMGLEEVESLSWESPFHYGFQGMLYVPDDIVEPNSSFFPEEVSKKAWPLIREYGGRTFVLCTSFRSMERVADDLRMRIDREKLSIQVLVQNDYPKQELLRKFKEEGSSILVGTMSFWEGVDIKGDALSLVVIDKIPFSSPGDPIYQGRAKWLQSQNRDPFREYALPEAVMTLRQGAGRLIRSQTDTGVLMICDVRLHKKNYGRTIWEALPDFARTAMQETALEFVESTKHG